MSSTRDFSFHKSLHVVLGFQAENFLETTTWICTFIREQYFWFIVIFIDVKFLAVTEGKKVKIVSSSMYESGKMYMACHATTMIEEGVWNGISEQKEDGLF